MSKKNFLESPDFGKYLVKKMGIFHNYVGKLWIYQIDGSKATILHDPKFVF
jgi:hypothetical protein